jgi:hypothetical protein
MATAITHVVNPIPKIATIAIAKSSAGNAKMMSKIRDMNESDHPPKYPVKRPSGTPINVETITTKSGPKTESRVAETSLDNTSRPASSWPSKCPRFGTPYAPKKSTSLGS